MNPEPFVMATDYAENTYAGNFMQRIYGEAFRRMDVALKIAVFPTKRLGIEVDEGRVDGQMVRTYVYADTHPALVRVEESAFSEVFSLYTADPALHLDRLEELPSTPLFGEYRRGVAFCENLLRRWLPSTHVSDVTTTIQGVKKMLARRTDIYCDMDSPVLTAVATLNIKEEMRPRRLLDLGNPLPLYPYVHRRHADMAPRLAAALKQMKAEGLIERYRSEAKHEFGLAP